MFITSVEFLYCPEPADRGQYVKIGHDPIILKKCRLVCHIYVDGYIYSIYVHLYFVSITVS